MMETIRQLWASSVPFRLVVCLLSVSLVLAITTANVESQPLDASSVDEILGKDEPGGLIDEIRKQLPGQQPKTPTGRVTKAAKDMTDIGARVGVRATKAGIDTVGEMADQVLGGLGQPSSDK